MSIAVFDDDLQDAVEPGTPSTAARLATVTAAADAGFEVGVFMMPILPFLTDSTDQLDAALARVKAAGATSVTYSALHLRPGVKEWFAQFLHRYHPELVERYRALYRDDVYAPKSYRRALADRIKPLIAAHGLGRTQVMEGTGSPSPALDRVTSRDANGEWRTPVPAASGIADAPCSRAGTFAPPLTLMTSPTTKLDSGEARKTYAGACSTGWLVRPSHELEPKPSSFSGGCPSVTCNGVHTGPGATAFTRIPRGARSWASALVNPLIPNLVVA